MAAKLGWRGGAIDGGGKNVDLSFRGALPLAQRRRPYRARIPGPPRRQGDLVTMPERAASISDEQTPIEQLHNSIINDITFQGFQSQP